MARSLSLAFALLVFAPCVASAHQPRDEERPDLTLSVSYADELASIDTESHAATALYVTAVTLHVAGLGLAVGGGIAGFCIEIVPSGCGSRREGAQPWVISGFVIAAVGLLTFIPAIVLDVDSGRRRHRLDEGSVAFSIGAGSLGIEATF